jgi:hypothetical protein
MKRRFLNEAVQREVEKDLMLSIAWGLLEGTYDDEIDPVHNLDWVRIQQKREELAFTTLRTNVESLRKEWIYAHPHCEDREDCAGGECCCSCKKCMHAKGLE